MPLLPSPLKMPNGVFATWYKVYGGTFEVDTRKVTARVGFFPDEATCLEGVQPLQPPITLGFDGADLDEMGAPELEVTELLHALVQTRAPFAPEAPAEPLV